MRLVVAAAGAEWPRPALAAVGLVINVMFFEKPDLYQPIDSIANGPQLVRVRARETMAQRHVAIGGNAHQPQARAARIRFAHALVDFFQRVFNVRKSVMPVFERCLQKVCSERAELLQHGIETRFRDRILRAWRGSNRREPYVPESNFFREMLVDLADVERLRSERDARPNGSATMPLQQFLDFRSDDIVTAFAVAKDAELVLHLFRPIDRDRNTHAIFREKFDDLGTQQCGIRGEAEIHRSE